ncbi:CBM35 domain-containing protein, partial [Paraliobacillus quinghaiensis]
DDATVSVFVNGNKKEIATSSTGDWGVFETTKFNVDLQAGDNTLKFVKGSGYVQLDYIKTSLNEEETSNEETPKEEVPNEETPEKEQPKHNTYEAEDATLNGAAAVNESGDASGGKYVSGYDDPATDSVEFNVNVANAGTYQVELSYATLMDDATVVLYINGSKKEVATPSTGDWGVFETTKFNVDLQAGDNTLKFVKGSGYVQLDYIKTSPSDGTVTNPQTSDSGIMLYVFLAVLALAGGALLVVRKRTLN